MTESSKNKKTVFSKIIHPFKTISNIGVGKSLLIWFLTISIIPLGVLSYLNYVNSYVGLTVVNEKALMTTSQLRVEYITSFFEDIVDFLNYESNQGSNIKFLESLKKRYEQDNKSLKEFVHIDNWSEDTKALNKNFSRAVNKEGFYDIYYIDSKGNVLFSLKNENDLGTNLFRGEYANTLFAKTCKKILEDKKMIFSDLEFYEPSMNKLSGFFGQVIHDKNGEEIGVLAVQITMDKINDIIMGNAAIGETGESYLIGKDLLYRSGSRFVSDSAILNHKSNNDKSNEWLTYINKKNNPYVSKPELKKGRIVTNYLDDNGKNVLGIYRNIDFLEDFGVYWALIENVHHNEAFVYARDLSDIAKISFFVTFVIVFFISILVTRWFVNPIKKISVWAKEVAVGQLKNKEIRAPKNEIGDMTNTFNRLVKSLQSYADVSQSAALGDYSRSVEIRSEEDVLGKSMNQMIESFKGVVNQSNKIAEGDYTADVVPRSEKDTLGISLFEMTKTLRETSKEIKDQDWLKTGINNLETKISGEKRISELTDEIVSFLVKYLDIQIGLLYLVDEENILTLDASYAFKDIEVKFTKIAIGDGLVGQVAKQKEKIIISNISSDAPEYNYSINKKIPDHYLIAPFIFEDTLIGVIQIGSFSPFTKLQEMFIDMCVESIAVAINSAQSHAKVQKLLEQTQIQANELTVQQEELRQTNEELEEQTKALKISEGNLQQQQEELRVTNEELEERTKALEIQRDDIKVKNRELNKAQMEIIQKAKDLEAASKYKSEFLANMSHELRTPLNSILVLSELLSGNKNNKLSNKEIDYAKTINSSGADLLNLINEILDLSKVEAGKLELNIDMIHFEELKDFINKSFSPLTSEKGIELIINIDKDVPKEIPTDIQRVHQIIKNLMSNAIKFTPKGSVTLSVHKPDESIKFSNSNLTPKNSIALSVIDTGIGIPKVKLESIFDAFHQADGTTSRRYGGTGLGLTISKSFSEFLGGEIHLNSTEGKGSIFTLYLPLSIEAVIAENEKKLVSTTKITLKEKIETSKKESIPEVKKLIHVTPKSIKSPGIEDDKDNLTPGDEFILIIEDDINFCKVLRSLAEEKGFKSIVALSGETGLHYAEYYLPSAIILDIGLPGIDGYTVMKRLKDNPKTRHIPVHFITASDKSIEAMKLGAIGYLTKPVNSEKLDEAFKKIKKLISKPLKKVLIVEDDKIIRKSIVELIKDDNILPVAVETGKETFEKLNSEKFDCMILDLGLEDISGFEILERIRKSKTIYNLPIIIYTGTELSKDDNEKLQKYANSIILKGAYSFERLLSETTLFLHQVESEMPEEKQRMLEATIHHKEVILEGKKILLVDDDMRNVFALSSILEDNSMKVIIGKTGKQGLEKLEENQDIDLVLMDIMMPEMDGYEAMRRIRKQEKYKKLPIIALTAKAMKGDRDKCIAAGANDYLAKPIIIEKFLSLLRVWLFHK
jgi:CheY-like chemotaxis protein/GAF domain-containing protein/HAMP domain-containing protein